MERVGEEIASRNSASADRWRTAHALALLPTIRKLMAAGFVSRRTLADELNRRGVPTARGGSWHGTTVERMLTRLGLITSGNNVLANKQAADVRAKALASKIRALRAKGLVSSKTIARKLNEREIPTALSGKWHPTSVSRLLRRLERLEPPSGTVVAPTSDAEPK